MRVRDLIAALPPDEAQRLKDSLDFFFGLGNVVIGVAEGGADLLVAMQIDAQQLLVSLERCRLHLQPYRDGATKAVADAERSQN